MGDKNVHISKLQIDSQIPREISKSIEDKNVHIYKLLIDSQIPRESSAIVKVLGKVWPGFKYKYDLDVYDLR